MGARAALAELKQAAELIPNAEMLINTLPVLEARASSEIENVVTTADELFRHLSAEKSADPATKEALYLEGGWYLPAASLKCTLNPFFSAAYRLADRDRIWCRIRPAGVSASNRSRRPTWRVMPP